jgi:hypothetical protein
LIDEKVTTPRSRLKGVANLYGAAAVAPGLTIDLSTPKKLGKDSNAKSKSDVITPKYSSGGSSSRRNRLVRKRNTNLPEKPHVSSDTQIVTVDVHEE